MPHCNGKTCLKTTRDEVDRRVCECDCGTCSDDQPRMEVSHRHHNHDEPRAPRAGNGAALYFVGVALLAAAAAMVWRQQSADGRATSPAPAQSATPASPVEQSIPMRVDCEAPHGVGATITCSVDNRGDRPSHMCWTYVVECGDGAHRARMCSDDVPANSTQSYKLPALAPPIADVGSCTRARVD